MLATPRTASSSSGRFTASKRRRVLVSIVVPPLLGIVISAVAGAAAAQGVAARSGDVHYAGRAADGAQVTLSVAAGAKRVDAYTFDQVVGKRRTGESCNFVGNGAIGVWKGVPVSHHTFSYTLGTALTFRGTFRGAGRITGTFTFRSPAVGKTPGCTTGKVHWSARRIG